MKGEHQAPTLSGNKVVLRAATAEDVQARLSLGNDLHIHQMFGGSKDQLIEMTREVAEAWVNAHRSHPYAWMIVRDRVIGSARLDRVDFADRRASFAIGILDPNLLGCGLGTEATKLVLRYAFRTLNLHRISLRVLAHNKRAIRSYEKCGFRLEGREREAALIDGSWYDDALYGLLEQEFSADE